MNNTVLNRRVTTQSIGLCPACNAWTNLMLDHIFRYFFLELIHEEGPLRPWTNYAHMTKQHIEKLRKLINARLAQEAAEFGSSRIVLYGPLRV